VLERFEDYWNADEIHLDRVIYLPIPDTTVRLANLRAGDIDMLERLAATDRGSALADDALDVEEIVSSATRASPSTSATARAATARSAATRSSARPSSSPSTGRR
jgi:ABC-type oligopeptide transport system substrate-binding subunit